jgi:hypothetical protein
MAIFNPSNQLLQIDTGSTRTFLKNTAQTTTNINTYPGIGENQVLGQLYYGVTNQTATNPSGSPAIFMLVQYLSTSAITTANLTTAAAPAPVYWTDNTFTTVTGITTEGIGGTTLGLAFPAGFMMPNTVSLPNLTAAQLLGSQMLIQIGGYLKGAYCSGSSNPGIGSWLVPVAGTLSMNSIAAGSSTTYQPFGIQLTALASGLCDVLVNSGNLLQ